MRIATFFLFFFCAILFSRNVELAIVRDLKDPECTEAKFRIWTRYFPKDARIIDAASLAHPEALADIKRIAIPAAPRILSLEMLGGLKRYVASGGLVITESIMNGIDTNGDFKEDFSLILPPAKRKAGHPCPGEWPPTGVCAHASIQIESVTPLFECPLSVGFNVNQANPLPFMFRNVIRADGNVIFTANAVGKGGGRKNRMPLVVVRNFGNGCFLFLPFHCERLVKNALSPQTLDWLTNQE